jgi:hypothetical protein
MESRQEAARGRRGITVRAVIVGLLIEGLSIAWVTDSEVSGRVFLSSWSLVWPALLALVALLGFNRIARRFFPRLVFHPGELVVIYAMTAVSVCITGYDMIQTILPWIAAPVYIGPVRHSYEGLLSLLPPSFYLHDYQDAAGIFLGESRVPWSAWLQPALSWGTLMLGLFLGMLSAAALVAPIWRSAERLSFPIMQLPVELIQGKKGPEVKWLMALGFLIPAILQTLLALRYYFPSVPAATLQGLWFQIGGPNSKFGCICFDIYPYAVGISFLLSKEVVFSCWFLFVLKRLSVTAFTLLGWRLPGTQLWQPNVAPYLQEQVFGGFLAVGALALLYVLRHVRTDYRESSRWPIIGLLAAFGFTSLFCWRTLGLDLALSAKVIGGFLLISVAVARVRAEAGTPWTQTGGVSVLSMAGPKTAPGLMTLDMLSDSRFNPMPNQAESFWAAQQVGGIGRRGFAAVLALATLAALVFGFSGALRASYALGIGTPKVSQYLMPDALGRMDMLSQLTTSPQPLGSGQKVGILSGAAITGALFWLRQQFPWFPLHPVGYIVTGGGTSSGFWFSYFLAWVFQVTILRFGGLSQYRRWRYFFLGVVLGDVLTQACWSLGAVLLGTEVYQFVS